VIDSATVATAAPDDDTTTVGTLGHLPVHHLHGEKINYHPKFWFPISISKAEENIPKKA
jgi:hypothetical protein